VKRDEILNMLIEVRNRLEDIAMLDPDEKEYRASITLCEEVDEILWRCELKGLLK